MQERPISPEETLDNISDMASDKNLLGFFEILIETDRELKSCNEPKDNQ